MAFIPVPDCIQANVNQQYDNQPVQNTLYFYMTTGISTFVCQALAEALMDYWIAAMIPLQSAAAQLFAIETFSLESSEGPFGQAVPTTPTFGGLAVDSAPNNVSASCSFRSGLRGRSHRGRNYWVGTPKANITGSLIDADYLGDVLTAYAGLMGPGTLLEDTRWAICSRFHNNEPRVAGITLPIVSVSFVDNIVDSMRNRLPQHNS